ncbi:MAG: PolC-type DNA polymerase III [Mycoplasmataceae bacterium]|nr:PolC-type DNA polymerase III [Mycoplasmataceae bacterium]
MNKAFINFCKEVKYNIPEYLVESEIFNVMLKDDKFDIMINFFSVPEIDDMKNFLESVRNNFKFEMTFKINYKNKNFTLNDIYDYLLFSSHFLKGETISNMISKLDLNFDDYKNLKIEVHSKNKLRILKDKESEFLSNLKIFGFDEIKILFIDLSSFSLIEKKMEEENDEQNILFNNIVKKNSIKQESKPIFSSRKLSQNKYFLMNMEEFYLSEETNYIFEGLVFKKEIFKTKTGMNILTIAITDYSEAIIIKKFYRNEVDLLEIDKITIGIKIKVFGEKTIDSFTSKPILSAKKIEIIEDQGNIVDEAPVKRVELSIRTSMSVMDGFKNPEEFLRHAKQLGHKALAIVDLENIQSFPNFSSAAKKIGIKPIYGSTFNVIDSDNKFVVNNNNKTIGGECYVVFDIETTGLSPRFDEVIEFGGVKIKDGKVIETMQFFIKGEKPISNFTTNLTGITQEMVNSGISEIDGIKKIQAFICDYSLIAHNASFDIGFLQEKIFKYGIGELTNQWIDTLSISKLIVPVSKSYRLEIMCKKFGVNYDSTIAHRAIYDAEVLSSLWLKLMDELNSRNIITFEDLAKTKTPVIHAKKFSNQITVLAKNQKGLKELFKLISKASTVNFYAEPRLFFKEFLEEKSDNILVGTSGIRSRLLEKVFNGTSKSIDDEIAKYDYIEIPSPSLFVHLINREVISQKNLEFALKDLIYRAKKLNKICVAVGDVRYIHEKEKILHNVYIKAKGLEGKRHYLFKYNENNAIYPMQNFLTTNQMIEKFQFLNDSKLSEEIVITNTNIISDLIEEVQVIKDKLYSPNFDDSDNKLKELIYIKAHEIYGKLLPKIVSERIERELQPILKYGFSVVYWISHILVAKSLSDGYLVGSRGSVGSSLVATLAKITEVNPLVPHYICQNCKYSEFFENGEYISGYDLPDKICHNCPGINLKRDGQTIPFETFLGFNADKIPDIDLNFSGEYQNIIHNEVKKMFGDRHCFRAGTISTVASTTAFGYTKNWKEEEGLNKSDAFIDFVSSQIIGTKRTTGQHPGGIIIIPKEYDVEDFTPVNFPANDTSSEWQTTHFDFHAIHDNVLKLDLLGHDDPTAIKLLQKLTGISPVDIPFSDINVIKMFSSTEPLGIKPQDINGEKTGVIGIPEFGTKFVRRMLLTANVSSFADLVSVSGLSHGTDVWSGNAEDLIKQRNLKLKDLISCRDDIMVFLIKKGIDPLKSFQIMEKVRKGMGLLPEEELLLLGNGVPQWSIDSLKKIKYMFPKAHATAYVMMAWRVAWFKLYHPIEYYATYFSTRSDHFDIETLVAGKSVISEKLKELLSKQNKRDENKLTSKEQALIINLEVANEMFARGFIIQNINLYKSDSFKWIVEKDTKSLIPPFISLDGLGIAAAESIIVARKSGDFHSIENFSKRTQVNKTIIIKMKEMKVFINMDDTDQTTLF